MNGDQLKKRIQKWAEKVGDKQARVALVNAGLGLSTVQKLIKGAYQPCPKGIAKTLEAVLSKEKAS